MTSLLIIATATLNLGLATPKLDTRNRRFGTMSLPAASGIAALPNGDAIVVGDGDSEEQNDVLGVLAKPGAIGVGATDFELMGLDGSNSLKWSGEKAVSDLEEAVTVKEGGRNYVLLVCSGSLNSKGNHKPKRSLVVKVPIGSEGKPLAPRVLQGEPLYDALMKVPQSAWPQADRNDFSIEGAAYVPKLGLLVGLRAPLEVGKAAPIFLVQNPSALGKSSVTARHFAALTFAHSSAGSGENAHGIRGMVYDERHKGCWILTGKSLHRKGDASGTWGLWFWKPKVDAKPTWVLGGTVEGSNWSLPNKGRPEGICVLGKGKGGLLIVGDPAEEGIRSPFLYLPFAR